MTTKAADDFEAIRRRLEEINAEKNLALTGSTQEEKPKETDWTSVGTGIDYCAYGAGNGSSNDWRKDYGLSSLAHPGWSYEGTAHEWRGFITPK